MGHERERQHDDIEFFEEFLGSDRVRNYVLKKRRSYLISQACFGYKYDRERDDLVSKIVAVALVKFRENKPESWQSFWRRLDGMIERAMEVYVRKINNKCKVASEIPGISDMYGRTGQGRLYEYHFRSELIGLNRLLARARDILSRAGDIPEDIQTSFLRFLDEYDFGEMSA